MTVLNPPVPSVFTRVGPITASSGDYTAAQVTNAIDGSQTAEQVMSGPLDWAAQATPLVIAAQVAANPVAQNFLLDADANPAFQVRGDGRLQWGAGGASALDVNLYRPSAGALQTDTTFQSSADTYARVGDATQVRVGRAGPGNTSGIAFQQNEAGSNLYRSGVGALTIDGTLAVTGGIAGQLKWAAQATADVRGAQIATNPVLENYLLAADANPSLQIRGDGTIKMGAGGASALDLQLYRGGAASLNTDATFAVGADAYVQNGQATRVHLGLIGGKSGISFQLEEAGSNLYRNATGRLTSDGGIGQYGVTPPASKPTAITAPASTAATQTTPWGFSTQAQADAIRAAVQSILTTFTNNGITA